MRIDLSLVCCIGIVSTLATTGCATQRCLEGYGTMTQGQVLRRDGEILTALVEHRRLTAEELQQAGEQSSRSGDLTRSIQAWEMAMAVVVQLQNLTRREEHATALTEHSDLTTKIRCLAGAWAGRDGHVVSAGDGIKMLRHQRELEEIFGDQGRPTDSQLSAIAEGREIYMGPVEEEVDVPDDAGGTGPSEAGAEGGAEEGAEEGEEGGEAGGDEGGEGAEPSEEGGSEDSGEGGSEGGSEGSGEEDIGAAMDDLLGE